MTEINSNWMLLPCAPDVCQECAIDHDPEEPHNRDSLYYQMTFYKKHKSYPTWEDAIAHCSDNLKYAVREFLREKGVAIDT